MNMASLLKSVLSEMMGLAHIAEQLAQNPLAEIDYGGSDGTIFDEIPAMLAQARWIAQVTEELQVAAVNADPRLTKNWRSHARNIAVEYELPPLKMGEPEAVTAGIIAMAVALGYSAEELTEALG